MSANVSKASTFSRVELEAVAYSEALVIIYKYTWISLLEDRNLDIVSTNSIIRTHTHTHTHTQICIFSRFLPNADLQIRKCSIEQQGLNIIPVLQVQLLRRIEMYTYYHPSCLDTWPHRFLSLQ